MRVLITRPQPDADRTRLAVRVMGFAPLVAPLLSVVPLPGAGLPERLPAALLFTSANAARVLANATGVEGLKATPAFAVGRRTAEAATEAGFTQVAIADGDADTLVGLVRQRLMPADGPLLWLAGEDRAGDPAGELAAAGFTVETRVIYRAAAATVLPAALATALTEGHAVALHYSRRTAATFADLAAAAGMGKSFAALPHLALSAQVAEPLKAAGCTDIRIAAAPRENELLMLLHDL